MNGASKVAHIYNPSYSGGGDQEDSQGQLGQKVREQIVQLWWGTSVISAMWEA
jgi:hypothetical protein